jgi:hypothetical protein
VVYTEAYDDLKVRAIINEIDGKDPLGTASTFVPNLFGMNFQAVSVAQKYYGTGGTAPDSNTGGIPVAGQPTNIFQDALKHTDAGIGLIVNQLKAKGLYDQTALFLTAKHGQDPRIGTAELLPNGQASGLDQLSLALKNANPTIPVAWATEDDVALLWLKDPDPNGRRGRRDPGARR